MSLATSRPVKATAYHFGEIALDFECSDERWLDLLETRYHAFRAAVDEPTLTLHYDCLDRPLPAGMLSPLEVHVEAPRIEMSPKGFAAVSATSSAVVDLDQKRAYLRGPRAMYPLDNLLRHLLPLLSRDGAIFHGAALANGDRGFLATGRSGAGKTTLARLAAGWALCDELTAVVGTDVEGYRIVSLPFWDARPGSASLDAVLLLEHGPEHDLRCLDPTSALKRLTTQILWSVDFPKVMNETFEFLANLVAAVPVFELRFAPRADVWDFLEKELP